MAFSSNTNTRFLNTSFGDGSNFPSAPIKTKTGDLHFLFKFHGGYKASTSFVLKGQTQ